MCRFYSGVRSTHLSLAHGPPCADDSARLSITTHYYKITDTIGALSAFPFHLIFQPHLTWHRPEAHYHCDVDLDPFTFLRENKKTYGSFLSLLAGQVVQLCSIQVSF